jgi:imidazole glycerol-phosphate synthase subunit HisH
MKLTVIDYGAGNLRSVAKALMHVAAEPDDIHITTDAENLAEATHIVLPGVGAFADCMRGLKALPGMLTALEREILQNQKPFLGICVGMQMLFERGIEHGTHQGLGWLKGEVVSIPPQPGLRIPHMGWNTIQAKRPHPVLEGVGAEAHAYFVHSYHCVSEDSADILATTDYGGEITAMVAKENILGTQFHPEKSQAAGLQILKNFMQFSL